MVSKDNEPITLHVKSRLTTHVDPCFVGSQCTAAHEAADSSAVATPSPLAEKAVMDVDSDEEGDPVMSNFEGANEAKLKELFRKINSTEIKLCSDATKQFIKLLKVDSGGELLHLYIQTSPSLADLVKAWKLWQGKSGFYRVMSLISTMLGHPDGFYQLGDQKRIRASEVLNSFARWLVNENLDSIYPDIKSKDGKRQNAALMLIAAVVRRGPGLAFEVAESFDFRLQGFPTLAGNKLEKHGKKKHSTRKSFVSFATSFLEVGKPGLLRSILRKREMYLGVLTGLGNDDDETVLHVLSTLRDKVLIKESLVSPALRSVLFGIATLEQLVNISRRENGPASEMAHDILVIVCTDPSNGLMPDMRRKSNPLKGNVQRLLGVMKKLKPTESVYHRDLLLAIIRGRPILFAAYMNDFPYNLEDHASYSWFSNVSLAADLVSSVGLGSQFDFTSGESDISLSFGSTDVQNVINCTCPRPFSRSVINKGLLHSDFVVKHGTLRLLLESLKLLDVLLGCLDQKYCSSQTLSNWYCVKKEIQDEIRTSLPDVQVLLTALSPMTSHSKSRELCLKRKPKNNSSEHNLKSSKRLRKSITDAGTDIIVSGVSIDVTLPSDSEVFGDGPVAEEVDVENAMLSKISELWSLDLCLPLVNMKDAEILYFSKLLDAFRVYLRNVPTALEGSFDFFMNLLGDPLTLQADLQRSLLSFLIEYIGTFPTGRTVALTRTAPMMYKHLQPFLNLLICSANIGIRDQAYSLARAAMLSTGAFDRNLDEIDAWFLFLPGYGRNRLSVRAEGLEALKSLSSVVISFLCDAVSTVGNNLFKYWDIIRRIVNGLEVFQGMPISFSPLIVCILQKCVRLLRSESGTFSLSQKSMISLYASNTLKYLLQTQVHSGLLSAFVESILSEEIPKYNCTVNGHECFMSERKPLQTLLVFTRSLLHQETYCLFSSDERPLSNESSLASTLDALKKLVSSDDFSDFSGIITAFHSAVVCTSSSALIENFPLVVSISQILQGVVVSHLFSVLFGENNFLVAFSNCRPELFFPGVEKALAMTQHESKEGDNSAILENSSFSLRMMCDTDFDEVLSATDAFALFLKQAPFYVLFPAFLNVIVCSHKPCEIKGLLLEKLSDLTSDNLVSNLRLVLFWFYQIRLCYRNKPLVQLEQLSEMCSSLLNHMFSQLLVSKFDCRNPLATSVPLAEETLVEVAVTIFTHPAVASVLDCPLSYSGKLAAGITLNNLEIVLCSLKQIVHPLDIHVLDVLTASLRFFFSLSGCFFEKSPNKAIQSSFSALVEKVFSDLRGTYNYLADEDFQPKVSTFYIVHALLQFISPLEVLKLGSWFLSRHDASGLTTQRSGVITALSAGLSITGGAFEILSTYLHQPLEKRTAYDFFWGINENTFDTSLIEEVYLKVCKLAFTTENLETGVADYCLLKAVNALYGQVSMQQQDFHPLSMGIARIIVCTPIEMVSHCVHRTNMTKAKLLAMLIEISPAHLQVFGKVILKIKKGNIHIREKISDYALSADDFIMLLPAAVSFLNLAVTKFGKQHVKHFTTIPSLYSRILFDGFLQWKKFFSKSVFQEDCDCQLLSSFEDFLSYLDRSVLGKAIHMLRYYCSFCRDSLKITKRLKLFKSLFPVSAGHEELLDCNAHQMDLMSLSKSVNLINQVVARISFGTMLLFPDEKEIQHLPNDENKGLTEMSLVVDKMTLSKLRFLSILVGTWQLLVQKWPSSHLTPISGRRQVDYELIYKWLEEFILKNIFQLTKRMHGQLVHEQCLPLMEQLMRSSLLYRFEDLTTLRILRNIMELLSVGQLSLIPYLELLLSHSQFTPTICSISKSSSSETGLAFKNFSSIFRYLVFPMFYSNANDCKTNQQDVTHERLLETVKLLRTFLKFKAHSSTSYSENDGINLPELQLLLLSSYGATIGQIDLEIYNILLETGFLDGESETISDIDYLWGNVAFKLKKGQALEQDTSNSNTVDIVRLEERRRIQFRENLPVDPKLCLLTALHFPYGRTASGESLFLNEPGTSNIKDKEPHGCNAESLRCYDPVFILRFSIHNLSAGYIELLEFVGLGLLAITFVGMSSPDLGMRKLGYEALGRFKISLENYKKKKEICQLKLLLAWLQNGIEEPWQRIPLVIAIFAAESSLILLDPMNELNAALKKQLMRSSRVNMKQIPFFLDFFQSSSVNFRSERLWMLRIAYGGLKLDDDVPIYIRNSILEILMGFYFSPLLDDESQELVLQIVNKSANSQKMACYLVETCGLIAWLSSILSIQSNTLIGHPKRVLLARCAVVIEVVSRITSWKSIKEWLKGYAFEQLMELSLHLYDLLFGSMKLIEESIQLVCPAFRVIISTLMISQEREDYQSHFSLSSERLLQIHQTVYGKESSAKAEFGLEAVLMSIPPIDISFMKHEKLSTFLYWATSTAQRSDSGIFLKCDGSYGLGIFEELHSEHEEPKTMKLLRWLTACVICGEVSRNLSHLIASKRCDLKDLKSLLEHIHGRSWLSDHSRWILAVNIYYLQQLFNRDCRFLPSVVSALCLLVLSGPDSMLDCNGSVIESCARIRMPPEANPSWRWSYHGEQHDHSPEPTYVQNLDEHHACQTLLIMIASKLRSQQPDLQCLSHADLEKSGVFEWERSIVEIN